MKTAHERKLLEQVEARGLTADFKHIRNLAQGDAKITARGGGTICTLVDAEGNFVAQAIATCNAKENYNKAIGRSISLGRAMKKLGA